MTGQAGGAAGKVPMPPDYKPIDIDALSKEALQYDENAYSLSDNDFVSRFPGLVKQRSAQEKAAADALTGPLNPAVQASFVRSGLSDSLSVFGDAGAGVGDAGSASRNRVAATVGKLALNKEDQDRSYLSSLFAATPERAYGLSGADVAKLMIGNTVNTNIANRNQYLAAMGVLQQQNAQAAQNEAGLISAGSALFGAAKGVYSNSGYGSTSGPYAGLTYGGGDGRP